MKALSITTALIAAVFFAGVAVNFAGADAGAGPGNPDCPLFVDANGDGINDNCTGDGTRPQDGTGDGARPNFVDEDGDGINDNCIGDGTGSQDGTGIRKKAKRGTRDGSGAGTGRNTRSARTR